MKRSLHTLKATSFFQKNPQIYVNRAVETFELPFHSHEFIEFALVSEGRGFHHIDDEAEPVSKGQLSILPVGVSHVFRPSSSSLKEPLIVYNCIIKAEILDTISPLITDSALISFVQAMKEGSLSYFTLFDSDGSIENLFQLLHREYTVQNICSTTLMNALLLQIIIAIYRHKNHSSHTDMIKNTDFLHILQYIDSHYNENISLSSMAQLCQWSERHFQRLFKQNTDQTFNHYLQNVRIRKSCEMLRKTQQKISVIAEAVGFKDTDYFNKLFKRIVGRSPRAYRQHLEL